MPPKPGSSRRSATPAHRPMWLQRVRRQDLILLVGALSLACLALIVVAAVVLRYQSAPAAVAMPGPATAAAAIPRPQPTYTVVYQEYTGLGQFTPARSQALSWASDAQLVAATASWSGVTSLDQVGAPGQWTYRFYSPAKQRLYIVKVEPDGRAQGVEHRTPVTLPPPVLAADTWTIDSPAALAIWLDYGGAELLRRNPGLEVLVQLRSFKDFPAPVWMIVGSDRRTQDTLVVVVDAAQGAVVSLRPLS